MKNEKLQSAFSLPKILIMLILVGGALILHACTSSEASVKPGNDGNKQLNKGEESFAFYDTTGGQQTYWEAVFKDHKLNKLYKNGIQIPDTLFNDYKDMVFNRLDNISGDRQKYVFRFHGFPFDSTFTRHRKHFKDHFMWMSPDSCFPFFNDKKFHIEMDSLKKELGKMKHFKFDFKFDSLKFGDKMRKMMEGLKHMHFDSAEFKMNMKEFEKGMKEFQKEMKNKKFDIDIDLTELGNQMDNLKEQMHHFKLDMSKVNKELKKYNHFIQELKKEMVEDDVIKKSDEDVEVKIKSNSMSVNGKKLPDKLYKKYKKLYKDTMGKDWRNHKRFELE